ncbi:MAG: methionyl-tRNA formyltransferase [Gammaproteobacteria bacterium]|nr:methionyl-tRNA formyltransferase [Gammaproteobacteria bacterium]
MKIVFAGTPDFAARHLAAIADSQHKLAAVITPPDKPGKRGRQPVPSPVKRLAESLGVEVRQPSRLGVENIADLAVDLLLVVAYGQILRNDVLKFPAHGCVNVHASLLPRWRGAAPIQRAILAGDSETGICIMQMDEGLDTGDILLQQNVPILVDDTSESLTTRLAEIGPPALLKAIDQIDTGASNITPQADAGVTYAKKVSKDEARINWLASGMDISRQIKGFNPDPVAFTYLQDLRIKVWQASPMVTTSPGQPGTIASLSKAGVEVTCGEGSLLISALQLPLGKGKILDGQNIINARRDLLSPGSCFS